MKYTTRTEYGLVSMIHIANHGNDKRLTIKEIAKKENYPVAYIEKILQSLRQANLVKAQSGNHGGYTLARPASEITLKQVIDALEGHTFDVFCAPEVREGIVCTHFCLCGVKPVWRKTKQILDDFYGSITLEMLTKNEIEMGQLIEKK